MIRDSSLLKWVSIGIAFEIICILMSGQFYLDWILFKMALGRAEAIPWKLWLSLDTTMDCTLSSSHDAVPDLCREGAIAKFPHGHFCSASVSPDLLESRPTQGWGWSKSTYWETLCLIAYIPSDLSLSLWSSLSELIWGAVSWVAVLFLPQIKLNSHTHKSR